MAITAGMTDAEAMFFKETKLPARLAAAAYSSSDDFSKIIPILDSSGNRKEICSHPLPKISLASKRSAEFEGLANWMLDIRVHIAIIPVELPDAKMAWDLALVFRGTQPYSVTNWVTDFTFDKEPVARYILEEPAKMDIRQHEMLVHTGFHKAFQGVIPEPDPHKDLTIESIRRVINKYIDSHRSAKQMSSQTRDVKDGFQSQMPPQTFRAQLASTMEAQPKPRRILSIGHSLGGALAVLGAAWCKTTLCNDKDFQNCPVQCITLGCPRVGNPAFAMVWDWKLQSRNGITKTGEGKSYRIVNGLDLVPSVPLSFEFQHVGMPVYLHREVQNWDVKVWPCLGQERPLPNTGSPIDHVQWHYTAAMVMAEATAASATEAERKSLPSHQSWWFLAFAQQLKPSFMWEVFKRSVVLDLPLHAHLAVLVLSWVIAVSSFVAGLSICWLALFPIITLLLPAFTVAFLVDCLVAAVVWPFKVCFGSSHNLIQSSPHYKFGNISLGLVSLVVMVVAYVSAWLGL